MEINERAHTHTHTETRATNRAGESNEEWAANETLDAEVDALHLTRPEGNTLQTHLANAGANSQRATSVKHGVYVIFDRERERERD